MFLKIISKKFSRLMFGFLAVILIALGASVLNKKQLYYTNYWGGAVFAPVAIFGGIMILFIVIFKWKKMGE